MADDSEVDDTIIFPKHGTKLVSSLARLLKLKLLRTLRKIAIKWSTQSQHQETESSDVPVGSKARVRSTKDEVRTLEFLALAVQEALDLGHEAKCPKCGWRTFKTRCNMHMLCTRSFCESKWCHCCGHIREQENGGFCKTCDNVPGEELRSNPLSRLKIAAFSDTSEFNCRNVLYFVKTVKDSVSPDDWSLFQNRFPHGLPYEGTGGTLSWYGIDHAAMPCFGITRSICSRSTARP